MNIRTWTVKYMSRLTRLPARLNSSGSQIFIIITPNLRPNLTLRFLSGKSPTSSQISLNVRPLHETIPPISPLKFHKFTTSAIPDGRSKTHPHATAVDSNTASPPPDSDNTLVVEHSVHVDNASPGPNLEYSSVEGVDQLRSEDVYANGEGVDQVRSVDVHANGEGVDQVRSENVYANGEGVDQVRSVDVYAMYANGEGVDQVRSVDVYANGEGVDQVRSEDVYANGEGEVEDLNQKRKVLPEELSRGVIVLSCESTTKGGVCDVFLVGTCHVSLDSCIKVQAVISYLKPQVVFLELCSSRVAVLTRQTLTRQSLKVPTMREMVEMLKKKQNAFGILYSWFLAKVATKLEVFPGSEFRVAFEEAKKYGGKVILGDRPVNITLRRTWDKMPLWHKTKLMYNFLFGALFLPSPEDLNRTVMDDSDMLTVMIQEMSKEFPTMMEALVHERDQYMSSTLLRVASEHSSVVAVVGMAHLQGIKKHWQQPVEMKDLMQMPPQKPAVSAVKVIASLGVAAAGVAIISGIYLWP